MSTYADGPSPSPGADLTGQDRRLGRLVVRLRDPRGSPFRERAVVFALEHRAIFAEQHRLESSGKDTVSVELPAGDYSLHAVAANHSVARGFVRVEPGRESDSILALAPAKAEPRSLAERLQVYGIEVSSKEIQQLKLAPGEKIALDVDRYPDRRAYRVLKPRSIDDLKRWTGSPHNLFEHDRPRFGSFPHLELETLKGEPSQEVAGALRAIAREYLHGNVKAVANYQPALTRYLVARRAIDIGVFFFNIVTFNAGATLEIGRGSHVFVCDELHIHQQGTLAVVGEVRADIGRYVVFG